MCNFPGGRSIRSYFHWGNRGSNPVTEYEDFRKAMRAAAAIFGGDAFRKRYDADDFPRPISMALFEAWSVQLARCSQEQLDRLVERRDEVRERFMALLNRDQEFEKAVSVSTGTPRRIRKRFAAIREFVQELV